MTTIANLLVRLGVDTSDVTSGLRNADRQFSALAKNVGDIKINADTSGASQSIAKTKSSVDQLAKGGTVNINADGSMAAKTIGKTQGLLGTLTKGATAPVNADTSLAQRGLSFVESKLQGLQQGITVPVRVESTGWSGPSGLEQQASKGGSSAGSAFSGGMLASMSEKAPELAAVLIGGAILTSGLKRATTLQNATAALTIMLGNQAKAAKFTAQITKTVNGTPFNLDQFVDAGKNLVAFNVPATKVPGILTAIGTAAAVTGGSASEVSTLVDTFGKMASQGKVSLDQVWSLTNSNVPALQILANGFGVTTDAMTSMISSGSVPAGKAIDLLTKGIMSGSDGVAGRSVKLGGSMEALRKTFTGSFGGMKTAAARLGTSIMTPLLGPMTTGMTKVADGLNDIGKVGKKLGPVVDTIRSLFGGGASKNANGTAKSIGFLGKAINDLKSLVAPLSDVFSSAFHLIKAVVQVGVNFVSDIWNRFGSHLVAHLKVVWDTVMQQIRGALQIVAGIFQFFADLLTGKWGKLWGDLKKIVTGVWNVVVGLVRMAINLVSTIIGLGMAVISDLWFRAWDGIHRALTAVWGVIERAVSTAFDKVVGFFTGLPGRIVSGIGDLAGAVGGVFSKLWSDLTTGPISIPAAFDMIVGFITGMPGRIADAAKGMFNGISDAFKSVVNWLISKWNSLEFKIPSVDTHIPGVGKVGGFTLGTPDIPLIAAGGVTTSPMLAGIGEAGQEAVLPLTNPSAMAAIAKAILQGMSLAGAGIKTAANVLTPHAAPATPGTTPAVPGATGAKTPVTDMATTAQVGFKTAGDALTAYGIQVDQLDAKTTLFYAGQQKDMAGFVTQQVGGWRLLAASVAAIGEQMLAGFVSVMGRMAAAGVAGGAGTSAGLEGQLLAGVGPVTDITRQFATAIAGALSPVLTGIGAPPITLKFAAGGAVPGAGNGDTVPAMLTPGEFVLRKDAVRRVGVGRLHALNDGVQRFASGGLVGALSALDAMVGKPYIWGGSGPGGTDCSGLWGMAQRGAQGEANPFRRIFTTLAFTGGGSEARAMGWLPGPGVMEIGANAEHMAGDVAGMHYEAHRTGTLIEKHKGGPAELMSQFGGNVWHFPAAGGNMFLVDAPVVMPSPHPMPPPGGPWLGGTAFAASAHVKDMAQKWTDAHTYVASNISGGNSGDAGSAGSGGGGALRGIAQSLLDQRGWGGQMAALDFIISHESGWNPRATNPNGGAFGLGQALPASKIDPYGNRNDPTVQLRWMMDYIGGRYGNPNNAQAFWQGHNWYNKGGVVRQASYDNGGWLQPGYTLAHNGTGQPERVGGTATLTRDAPLIGEVHVHDEADAELVMRRIQFIAHSRRL